ncbi:MAG: dienelactone hydrolase family protein [bacterium]
MGQASSGFIYLPEGEGPFPAVVLMHGCSGLVPAVNKGLSSHANFLVKNGYAALILDSFSQRGNSGGSVCDSHFELQKARFYRKLDAYNALQHLQKLPNIDGRNIFLMGQSNGGSAALGVAKKNQYPKIPNELNFSAIAAFYPWCGAIPRESRVPILILGGDKDDWTPTGECEYIKNNSDLGKPYNLIVYEGAHHSFDLFIPLQTYSGHTVGGNSKAREDSKQQMLEWFERFRI